MDDDLYSRNRLLPGWDQPRMAAATVVVAGVGALGNIVAQTLALAGVGRLILCDPDTVERSNLSRGPLFRAADIGRPKVQAAAAALADLAPGVTVDPRPRHLAAGVGLAELRDATLVMGCLDSRSARLELSGRCALVQAPWIDGATGVWDGEVRPYLQPDGPCFACGRDPETLTRDDVPMRCGLAAGGGPYATAMPISATIGSLMALAGVRFILGLAGKAELLVLDGRTSEVRRVAVERGPGCPYHRSIPEPPRPLALGSADTVGALLQALGPGKEPLAWTPVAIRVACRHCGYSNSCASPTPLTAACPKCGGHLIPRTSLELSFIDQTASLESIGIPPREILAVRTAGGLEYVELTT